MKKKKQSNAAAGRTTFAEMVSNARETSERGDSLVPLSAGQERTKRRKEKKRKKKNEDE